jgi:hypothetical protein
MGVYTYEPEKRGKESTTRVAEEEPARRKEGGLPETKEKNNIRGLRGVR